MIARRSFLLLPLLLSAPPARAADAWAPLMEEGAIVLFRHANAPGTGDPPGFVLGDCATQRNLDERGREEARAIGEAFRRRGVEVGSVLSSQWCRALETAELAFPGQVREEAAFNSFFGRRHAATEATARARELLLRWKGPGTLVVVTHQVNITALTELVPRPGEGIVLRPHDNALSLLGRIPSPPVQN
ncbi:histidine phosphatase family protein [Aestuariivirga sp.]|uniref:histidine phosphatase family protein n=1 Tax=Aestuariivirga sp. TaxID=2650926 RepID=UPI003918E6FB